MPVAVGPIQPPMNDAPLAANGQWNQSWAAHLQNLTEQLTALGTGSTTNDNAPAGEIGEFIGSVVLVGAAIGLTTNVVANVTSLALSGGDWDVRGEVWFQVGTGAPTAMSAGISQASAAIPGDPSGGSRTTQTWPHTVSVLQVVPLATCRVSLAAPATVYLVAVAQFPSGAVTGFGRIEARRPR